MHLALDGHLAVLHLNFNSTWVAGFVLGTVLSILNHLSMDYWKTMGGYILLGKVDFLVNLKSCYARVLNWAIQENIEECSV